MLFSIYIFHPVSGHVFYDSIANSRHIVLWLAREYELYEIPRTEIVSKSAISPEDNILLIIDESVRADYLSAINENVGKTTPWLSKYLSEFNETAFNYGIMLAGGTNSFLGRSIILTGISRLPDEDFSSQRNPTVFQVAKANGYKTVLIDLQGMFPYSVIRKSDMGYVDEVYLKWSVFSSDPKKADIAAAAQLRKRMNEEKGLFIVLLKWGVHVHYEARYPGSEAEHQHFLPKLEEEERHSSEKRLQIVNSYKNALRYNVDGFFSALLGSDLRSLKNTTILWTSDHGQSLQEDGQLEPHSSSYIEQALVPFVMFSTNRWVLDNLKRPKDIEFTLSHMNIYPSLCSIMEKKTNVINGEYTSLFYTGEPILPPLCYVYGSLWNGIVAHPDVENNKLKLREEKYLY
ncbi:MAG: sulfatase-like hydrolase/transferase [Synergistaceae bacterium]|nr:sulfatase-like hydrolase/transferase [Synergistaceae bacterium]